MLIEEFERNYRNSLDATQQYLEQAFSEITAMGQLPLDTNQITRAILLRMRSYYVAQDKLKVYLNKRYRSAAADYFVEAVIFYLMLLNKVFKLDIVVKSEVQIVKGLRPDISIWQNEKLISIIECKTQLGWNRGNWENDFLIREEQIHEDFPNVKTLLLVLTEINWSGFGQDDRLGQSYFVLSKVWPSDITTENLNDIIITPIEILFGQIKTIVS